MKSRDAKLFPLDMSTGKCLRLLLALFILVALLASPLPTSHAGGALINRKISGTLPAFGNVDTVPRFQISPDSNHVVYLADQETDENLGIVCHV